MTTEKGKKQFQLAEGLWDLADALFKIGAIQFGAFKLKLHEKEPNAPLSPIYINLRTPNNPKPGPLTLEIVKKIGVYLYEIACLNQLDYDAVAGIPRAGNPLAMAFAYASTSKKAVPILTMQKEETTQERQITRLMRGQYNTSDVVIVVDDLITKAESKIEAIRVLENAGLKVQDILVLIDREQGGTEELKKAGYNLFTAFKLSTLLKHYLMTNQISQEKYNKTIAYIANN